MEDLASCFPSAQSPRSKWREVQIPAAPPWNRSGEVLPWKLTFNGRPKIYGYPKPLVFPFATFDNNLFEMILRSPPWWADSPHFREKKHIESYRYGKPNEETQGKGFFEMFQWVPNISMLTWWRVRRQKLAMFTVKMSWVRLSDVTVAKSNQTKIWELGRHEIYHLKQGYGQHSPTQELEPHKLWGISGPRIEAMRPSCSWCHGDESINQLSSNRPLVAGCLCTVVVTC